MIKVSVPGKFQFRVVSTVRSLVLQQPEEIHYIGGADVLPLPLDAEEEAEAIRRLDAKDPEARSLLIEHNLRLVVYIAKKFDNTGVEMCIRDRLNIAVVTNTMPNTGVTLPFISYGGTSLMFLMVEIGLVLNVSNQIQAKS